MFAFKKLIFDFYPEMKEGNFLGNKVGEDKEKDTVSYELSLPTQITAYFGFTAFRNLSEVDDDEP